jgi:glycosyltransferase involved in cell wall biosynthesis
MKSNPLTRPSQPPGGDPATRHGGGVARRAKSDAQPVARLGRALPAPRRAMRVGYVIDRFPRGSHDFVLQEIMELESRGIDAHVFSLGGPDGRIDDITAALARVHSPIHYFAGDVTTAEADDNPADANETMSEAARWIAEEVGTYGLEHLHAHGATDAAEVAREAGRLSGLEYSFTAHAESLYEGVNLRTLRERILDARFVVALSDFDRKHLLSVGGTAAASKLYGIRLGVNPDEWRFSIAARHDADSILAIGPLVEKSGFVDLIDAIGILRDRGRRVRLTIVGQGELEHSLRAHFDRRGLADQVRLIRGVSRRELAILMGAHTVMALPWLADDRDRDALSNIVLEAMSVGLLVLSTDLPGISELIEDGVTGRVVSAHDPIWLAGALETLFASPEVRDGMARRARSTVERRFSASRHASHLAKLFSEAVARRRLTTVPPGNVTT